MLLAELFLAIMKVLAMDSDPMTLLELSLANKTLAALGLPILKKVPIRPAFVALHEFSDNEGTHLTIHEAFTKREAAQDALQHAAPRVFSSDRNKVHLDTPSGWEDYRVEKRDLVGN
jgi:hypothetical protein